MFCIPHGVGTRKHFFGSISKKNQKIHNFRPKKGWGYFFNILDPPPPQPPLPPPSEQSVTRVVCPPGPPAYPDSSTATQADALGMFGFPMNS